MSSATCKNCGFVCPGTDGFCRRCGTPLGQQSQNPGAAPAQASGGIPRVPEYGLPRSAAGLTAPGVGIWRQGSVLVFHKSAVLPDRCIKCNAPALGTRVDKTLYWHHPALALLILAGLLIYAIVAIVVRKSAKVSLGFCELHKSRRTKMLIAGWLLFATALAAFIVALGEESGGAALGGVALLLAAVVVFLLAARFIQVKKIDDHYVWLKGVDPAYLDQIPPLTAI